MERPAQPSVHKEHELFLRNVAIITLIVALAVGSFFPIHAVGFFSLCFLLELDHNPIFISRLLHRRDALATVTENYGTRQEFSSGRDCWLRRTLPLIEAGAERYKRTCCPWFPTCLRNCLRTPSAPGRC